MTFGTDSSGYLYSAFFPDPSLHAMSSAWDLELTDEREFNWRLEEASHTPPPLYAFGEFALSFGMPPGARADRFFPGGTAFAAPCFSVWHELVQRWVDFGRLGCKQAKQHVKMNINQ
ncbi:hypothetical protein VKT23_011145 [Stygiomarasmius scandens]|uniref:Uncharacterized protein n=1 Tax=Marasmiellus scandens TaxID=2682957 RepID=A0ABR1JCH7_9AGAR